MPILFRTSGDGFREELNPSYELALGDSPTSQFRSPGFGLCVSRAVEATSGSVPFAHAATSGDRCNQVNTVVYYLHCSIVVRLATISSGFFMSLVSVVAITALALACLAFGLFWYFTVTQLNSAKQAQASIDNAVVKNEAVAVSDVTRMLESAGSLIDSLAKAGPSLFALAASVLFLAIAAYTVTRPDAPSNADVEGTSTSNWKPASPRPGPERWQK